MRNAVRQPNNIFIWFQEWFLFIVGFVGKRRLVTLLLVSLILPMSASALTETTTDPNDCSSVYSISGLDGISSDTSDTTNYYVSNDDGSWLSYNKNIYLKFTPNANGTVTLYEGTHPWGNEMEVKFYVGTGCDTADIVNDDNYAYTHGDFTFDVIAGQTYYVKLYKYSDSYMRYSLRYSFVKQIASNSPNISISPTNKNISPATSSVDLDIALSEAPNVGSIDISYTDCDDSNKSINVPVGSSSVTLTANTSSLTSDGDTCQVIITTATGQNGQKVGSISPNSSTITVASNAPDISIDPASANVTEGTSSVSLAVKLSEAANMGDILINYTDGCSGNNGTLTIPKGTTQKELIIDTSSKNVGDSCSVTLNSASGQNGQKTGNITPNTSTITIVSVADEAVPNDSSNPVPVVCGAFSDVLQTRKDPSEIKNKSGASAAVFDSPDCTLDTGDVDFGTWQHLRCNDNSHDATASGHYAKTISVNYDNPPESANVDSNPSSSTTNETVTTDTTLSGVEYNQVDIGSGSTGNLNVTFSQLHKINSLRFTTNNIATFSAPEDYNLEIGSVGIVNNGSGNTLKTSTTPKNIKIADFDLPGGTTVDFSAKQTIKINNMHIGRDNSKITLKAQYVQINTLNQSNSGSDGSEVTIIADYVDIGTLDLDQQAKIKILPYTSGKRVLFRSNSISASSSSTMLVSSGNYYTKSFDIPGSSDISSIRAIDNNQLINFYINGDFKPGNNPGINSDGNDGKFGNLPPVNFLMFINGDLDTGGGGTTFNATVYVEGQTTLGSPTYIKGALSSNGDIEIGNDGEFYYDQSIGDSTWGDCSNTFTHFDNRYSCGIFKTALVSYTSITSNSDNDEACGTLDLSYPDGKMTGEVQCFARLNCTGQATPCNREEPPKNKFIHGVPDTNVSGDNNPVNPAELTDISYGNLIYGSDSNKTIHFNPANSYSDNSSKKLLVAGDLNIGSGYTISFEPGDYYFRSITIDGNNNKLILPNGGPVRIFVKNDFNVKMNNLHLNEDGDASNLLIYVKGNVDDLSSGDGNASMKAFLYAQGSVTLNNDSPNWEIHGGITAEGPIVINGNNPHFIQDSTADEFGMGECKLCYSDIQIGGMIFNMMGCGGFSMFKDIKVPILANETLDNVTVDEVHDQSMFNFSFMSTNEVIDKNGNKVADAQTVSSGFNQGAMGMDMTLFGGKTIIYPIGSPYGPETKDTNYHQIHNSSMFDMGFNPCTWGQSLVYIGHYDDEENRHYDVTVEKCKPTPNETISEKHIASFFEAVDDFRWDSSNAQLKDGNIANNKISTKIVNSPFKLAIVSMANDHIHGEAKPNIDVKYGLYYPDEDIVDGLRDVNFSNTEYKIDQFKVVGSHKKMFALIYYCANYDDTSNRIDQLFPLAQCWNQNMSTKDNIESAIAETANNITKGIHLFYHSSDTFAVRPDDYNITVSTEDGNVITNKSSNAVTIKAGHDFNIEFGATDKNSVGAKDYNESISNGSFDIGFTDTNLTKGCIKGSFKNVDLTQNWKFSDGFADMNSTYDEVGVVDLNITDTDISCEQRYASIDCNDSNVTGFFNTEQNTTIGTASIRMNFVPGYFDIQAQLLDNHPVSGGDGFTYISNDLNNSAELNVTITAKSGKIDTASASDPTTKNYNSACYAKSVDLNTTYLFNGKERNSTNPDNSGVLNNIIFDVINAKGDTELKPVSTNSLNNGKGKLNISDINKNIFDTDNNGTGNFIVRLNFNRVINKPVNPFVLNVTDLNTSDSDGVVGKLENQDMRAVYYYARARASKFMYDDVTDNSIKTPVYIDVYYTPGTEFDKNATFDTNKFTVTNDFEWFISSQHNNTKDGEVKLVSQDTNKATVTNTPAIVNGKTQDATVTDAGNTLRPFIVDINMTGTSSWLIYNKDKPQEPSPFYRVRFTNPGNEWAGYGKTGRVVETNASKHKVRRLEW